MFVGLHAPHRATEATILSQWWQDTQLAIRAHCRGDLLVLAGDLNAAVGSNPSANIGTCAPEEQDEPGAALHAIVREFSLFLPATWESIHHGASHTYCQKRGHKLCRADYIGLPLSWASSECWSSLAPQIHAAHSCQDHTATITDVRLRFGSLTPDKQVGRHCIRAKEVLDPSRASQIEQALSKLPEVPWACSAHAHAALLAQHVHDAFKQLRATQPPTPHRTYLQEETWKLQRRVASVRRALHRLQHRRRQQFCAACFEGWMKFKSGFRAEPREAWLKRSDHVEAAHVAIMRRLGLQLKKACKRDRDTYISTLADQLSSGPTSEVFANLHAVLGHKRKKKYQADPLPAVKALDGTLCPDRDAYMARWRQHFGGLEGGKEVDVDTLAGLWDERARNSTTVAATWPQPAAISDVPTEVAVRRLLTVTRAGKSPGLDGIPAELGRRFAHLLAPHLHRIALKVAFGGSEPAGFKSGESIWFYKGRGEHSVCGSHRAILLLPVWSKIIHQALRPPMKLHFEQTAPALQLGGRSHVSVVYGSHIIRGAARCASALGLTHFTLFADIASAFYCVVQQLVANWSSRDGSEAIIDDTTFSAELQQHLKEPTALNIGGASAWLEAVTSRLQEDNFFLLRGDSTPVLTTRGSRPGSSWADLVFAALIRRILDRRNELRAASRQLSKPLSLPWDGLRCLTACDSSAPLLEIQEVIWADDIAIPRVVEAAQAASGVGQEAGFLTDSFREFGFCLAYGPHKTAGLLTIRGRNSRRAKQEVFGPGGLKGSVPVLLEHPPSVSLPLVTSYRHLGSQQSVSGRLRPEIQYRISQAHAAFAEGRRKVYRNPAISIQRKAFLLGSLVLPRLVFGAGSWGPLLQGEFRVFAGAVWTFYRAILGSPQKRCLLKQGKYLSCPLRRTALSYRSVS